MRVKSQHNNSIDSNIGDLNNYLLLAENIPKYPCCFKEVYPPTCAPDKCGKWNSISKVLKLKPKSCKQRWKTLRKHFGLGLLTNKQLIDKLQFLKDVANEIPVTELRNYLTPSHNTPLPATKNNPNLIVIRPVNLNITFEQTKNTDAKTNERYNSCSRSVRICTERIAMSVGADSFNIHEKNIFQETTVAGISEQPKNVLDTGMIEKGDNDSDLEIIEPYIETIVIDD